jgi:hypothetical protein
MTQSFELAKKFLPVLDEIYKQSSLTVRLDTANRQLANFTGTPVVEIYKTTMGGLGDMARGADYPAGEIVGVWELLTLATHRARKFSVARMDNEETLGLAFGMTSGEFMRTKVIPELDAYRFAKYASTSNIGTTSGATLSSSTVLAALDAAKAAIRAAEVDLSQCLLFVSDAVQGYLEAAVSRTLGNENSVNRLVTVFDSMPVITVPQTRFYTQITLEPGASAAATGGYSKTNSTGKDINFMIIHPPAVVQVKKHELPKIFSPDENQDSDNWIFAYDIYHDAFVLDNKVGGIYLHKKA